MSSWVRWAQGTSARLDGAQNWELLFSRTSLTVENEFRHMVPDDVSYHVARCLIPDSARSEREKEDQFLSIETERPCGGEAACHGSTRSHPLCLHHRQHAGRNGA